MVSAELLPLDLAVIIFAGLLSFVIWVLGLVREGKVGFLKEKRRDFWERERGVSGKRKVDMAVVLGDGNENCRRWRCFIR